MSALSVIRGGVIGILAVAAPAVALGIAVVCIIRGLGPYLGMLGVTLVLVGGLAWACVRVAHFPARLAIFLTTLPFGLLLLLTLSALVTGNPGGFVIGLAGLALAVLVAWGATHLASR
jgi:hypothetical protein